jgi:hypothetical protein
MYLKAHYVGSVCLYVNRLTMNVSLAIKLNFEYCPSKLIDRDGPIPQPRSSPDLSPLDLSLCSLVKASRCVLLCQTVMTC